MSAFSSTVSAQNNTLIGATKPLYWLAKEDIYYYIQLIN